MYVFDVFKAKVLWPKKKVLRYTLIILEAAMIGGVAGYGIVGLWHEWKISQEPESVVERFELRPISPRPTSPQQSEGI